MSFQFVWQCVMAALLAWSASALWSEGPPIKLMFGEETKEKPRTQFLDFGYVTPAAKLEGEQAWGWTESKKITAYVFGNDRLCSNPMDSLVQHCVTCWDGTFSMRVPNGPVAVHLWVGDAYQGIRRTIASYQVQAEDKVVADERITFKTVRTERWWLRGESEVYREGADRWVRLVEPILDEHDFTVQVTDGALDLKMKNVNLCALVAIPGGDAAAMQTILSKVETERRKEFAASYPWVPQPDEPMPTVSKEDQRRGFVVFQKLIDDEVYPWTRATKDEVTDTVRVFAARGEQEAFRFGILPLRNLARLTVQIGDFTGPNGAKIDTAKDADLWTERYTERGSASTTGKDARLDPVCDVLMSRGATDYEPGLPRMFTLDLRVPRDATAGYYRASVTFRSSDTEIAKAELLLRVLPWELPRSPVPYSFQATYVEWTDLAREDADRVAVRKAMEERVRFIGKYGFSASYFSPMDGWGTITGDPGSRHFTQTPQQAENMDWWYQLVMKEGNATQWIQYHWPVGFWIRAGWRPPLDFKDDGTGAIPEVDRKDLVQCIRDFADLCRKKGYPKHYWYGSGEPDNFGLAGVERGNEYAKIVHDAGGETLCALNGPIAAKLAPPFHDIVLANHATPITQEFIDYVKSFGHQFGSHNTSDSRLAAGYQFWILRGVSKFQEGILYVSYTVPCTYLPWNYKAAAAYPMADGGWRPTVRWLRYRDGRDDYVYMHTLEQRLAKARAAGLANSPAAKDGADFLAEMKEKIYLDPSKYFGGAVDAKEVGSSVAVGWTAKRFDRYRWLVATLIMNLDAEVAHAK